VGTALSPAWPAHTPGTGSSAKPLPDPLPPYDQQPQSRGWKTPGPTAGRCHEPLDAKRHRYGSCPGRPTLPSMQHRTGSFWRLDEFLSRRFVADGRAIGKDFWCCVGRRSGRRGGSRNKGRWGSSGAGCVGAAGGSVIVPAAPASGPAVPVAVPASGRERAARSAPPGASRRSGSPTAPARNRAAS